MLMSYFKIAWRNLLRNKILSGIKILGLSIGLSTCMLIFLFTKDEMTFDQFHQNKANLYRITETLKSRGKLSSFGSFGSPLWGRYFAEEIPEVKGYVGVTSWRHVTVKHGNDVFSELPLFADDNFFSVFTFPLLQGNKNTALKEMHSMVLSRDVAVKYFGTTNVIGKMLQVRVFGDKFKNFMVTAVAENAPPNSTFKVDIVLPLDPFENSQPDQSWRSGDVNTFLLLSPKADIKLIEKRMQSLYERNVKEELIRKNQKYDSSDMCRLGLQPLTNTHLSTKIDSANGADRSDPIYSYILSCIAVFILIIACINFINLTIAQSLKRTKEIGIRKVSGGTRSQLIKQFLVESFLVSLLAFIIAILITNAILPFFNQLANKRLSFSYLTDDYVYAGFFLLLLVTSFIAGFYPSLVLSAFQPVKVLYSREKLMGKNYFTKALFILQFSLAIFLMIGAIAVNTQLNYVVHADRGLEDKNVVRCWIPANVSGDRVVAMFKSELIKQPDIVGVTAANIHDRGSDMEIDGHIIPAEENKIDRGGFNMFKIPLISGRNFSPDYPSDVNHSIIVNETFVKSAGLNIQSALGKTVKDGLYPDREPEIIIGVIKDFNFFSMHDKISAQVYSEDTSFYYSRVFVKIRPHNIRQSLAAIQKTYEKILPDFPYSYQFVENINVESFTSETQWKKIISIASIVFVFISCMGLLGLVMLSIEQRTKEIGIRKVLGAAVSRIVVLISKEFITLISIAFVIAVPVGYYFVNKWLQDFAYRINIGWWMFAAAGIFVLAIALLTMSFQTIKAARANPVKSLKTE
jgi:putative ABC transport system permease protein